MNDTHVCVCVRKKIRSHNLYILFFFRWCIELPYLEAVTRPPMEVWKDDILPANYTDLMWWSFFSPPVRRASANVISIVAKYAVPAGEWSDLLPYLFQCSQSAQEDHREVSYAWLSSHVLVRWTLDMVPFFSITTM